ncbi:MAG: hypothetical protein K9I02_01690 [Haliscomenobacter sp.]|nr:hypothetical protein [Haliscomenobacter sp.]
MSENLIPLSSIISEVDVPEALSGFSNDISDLVDGAFIGDLHIFIDPNRENASYRFNLITFKRLGLEFPGTNGLALVLNPDTQGTSRSSFPVAMSYNWGIMRYLDAFDLESFNYSPESIFNLVLKMFNMDKDPVNLLQNSISVCYPDEFDGEFIDDPFALTQEARFIEDFNTKYNPFTPLECTTNADDLIDNLLNQMVSNGNNFDVFDIILNHFILSNDFEESLDRLESIFSASISVFSLEYLKSLLIPKLSASLDNITLALEFPRDILIPIDLLTGEVISDENVKSRLKFDAGHVLYSSTSGFEFETLSNLLFDRSQIGKTGLIVELSGVKIDLSDAVNIPQADEDNRPTSFKGIFIDDGVIVLPPDWKATPNSSNPQIITNDLLIGTEGGVSGTIKISGTDKEQSVNFIISGITGIVKDATTGNLTIAGTNGESEIKNSETTGDTYIRDISRKLYKIDDAGVVTCTVTSPPVQGVLNFTFDNGLVIALDSFSLTFYHDSVVSGSVIGYIEIPALSNNGVPLRLNISVAFDNGFLIKVFSVDGQPIIDNNNVQIILNGLEIGKQDALWKLGFSGSIENKASFPAISDLIPKRIDINEFSFQSGQPLNYDVNIEWPGGLTVGGTDEEGIRAYIPINKTIGDVASLEAISIMIDNGEEGTELLVELKNAGLKLGPASVKVDGFGMKATIAETSPGNLGPFDVDLEIIPPSGLSISVESAILSGGGILVYKPSDGSYMGSLVLSFKKISLSAIGILNTQMPDGSSGFSLLIIITTTFSPTIQLGMGFNLGGVGGLLGIHRTIKNTELQAGVKNGSLEMILFPTPETVKNNPLSLISQVAGIFPVMSKHYVVGPMAKIGWGTPSIITLDFGILIELPDPKIAVLGVLKSVLPSEEKCIVRIQVNFAGYLDFQQKELMFFASIYNSKILTITLQGDMGLLINWGSRPLFILSAGGFHPSYVVPPNNLPALQRMSISLCDTDNLQVKFESYFAVTSNSVQFGSAAWLRAKQGKFFAKGDVGFDVLVLFNPFYFEIGLYFRAEAGRNSRVYLGVDVDAHLTGPNSWHVWGKASFKILGVRVKINFDKTIGQKQNEIQPSIEVKGQLLEAFGRNENWEFLAENMSLPGVSLAELDSETLFFHPNGALQVKQSFLPLGINLEKFGNSKISDAKKFTISNIKVADIDILPNIGNIQKDYFCPGEYIELSKDERLSRPSFELYECGVKFSLPSEDSTKSSKVLARDLGTLDTTVVPPAADPFVVANSNLGFVGSEFYEKFTSNNGFYDNSSHKPFAELMSADGTKLELGSKMKKTYGINLVDDLSDYDSIRFDSFTEAEQYLKEVLATEPELEEELMVHYK